MKMNKNELEMGDYIDSESSWTFLTNHAHVLLCLAKCSSMRMKDIAIEVGITERAVQRIIADLISGGCIFRTKDGRCNTYSICMDRHLNHPIEAHRRIADLVGLIVDKNIYSPSHDSVVCERMPA